MKKDTYYGSYFKVTNRDSNQSLPEVFNTFTDAFTAQQKWDRGAVIEDHCGESVEVVWTPDYENYMCNNIFVINRNTLFH